MQSNFNLANNNGSVTKFYSVLLALNAGVWTLTSLLLIVSPMMQNVMAYLYILVASVWGIATIFTAGKGLRLSAPTFVMMAVCIIAYLATIMFSPYRTSQSFLIFFCEIILSLLLVQVAINARTFLLTSMLMPLIGLPYINNLFVVTAQSNSLSMGMSYAFMLPAICTIIYLLKYFRFDKGFKKFLILLLIAINLMYVILVVSSGSRGVIISFIFTIVALYMLPYNKEKQGVRMKSWRSVIFIVVAILIGNFFWEILGFFHNIFNNAGFTNYGLDRTIEYHKKGDALTGRNYIIEVAWDAFLKKPVFGHGVATFSDFTHEVYPYIHNSVLQLLFDGGIVLFLLVIYPLFRSIKNWLKNCSFDDYVMMMVLFGASVPGSLFSHDLWNLPILWVFIGYSLKYYTNNKPIWR